MKDEKYSGSDFYCDLAIAGKLDLEKEYESDAVLAYHHTKPFWPVHIVVVPKQHIASLTTLEDMEIARELLDVLQQIAGKVELEYGAARVLTNLGEYQDSKHLHFHISSGKPRA
jgi:histidine triad (HIT) family protein